MEMNSVAQQIDEELTRRRALLNAKFQLQQLVMGAPINKAQRDHIQLV
jgi:hypothetical protein